LHHETGMVRFLRTDPAHPIPVTMGGLFGDSLAVPGAAAAAWQFLGEYGSLFGLRSASAELTLLKEKHPDSRHSMVRFQQTYQGIPILAGELNVQLVDQNQVLSVNGEVVPNLHLSTTPRVTASDAAQAALKVIGRQYSLEASQLSASPPELWIFNRALLGGPGPRLDSLVWRVEVRSQEQLPIRELVLVDAQAGFVALHFNQVDTALSRAIYDNDNVRSDVLPGTGPVRMEGGPAATDADVNYAYQFSGDTYTYYSTLFSRDSLDGVGMNMISTVDFCPANTFFYPCPYPNAFWNGTQMVYGDGYASADDVVGHEMTHAVTENESHLFYYYQSGAINEALSDIFGELIDLSNGDEGAADTPWLMGEDLSIGAIRSMSNPTAFGDPDSMLSISYTCDLTESDNGGVHQNSGVANKAAYLLAQSDQPSITFNGATVTPIGGEKTARVFYKAQTELLLSGSDYQDLATALPLACSLLVGQNGLTAADCQEVQNAVTATQMNMQPSGCATPAASICPAGQTAASIFSDNFETPTAGLWASSALSGAVNEWYYPQTTNPYDFDATYTTSGVYNLWGYNSGSAGDYAISLASPVTLPAGQNLYLSFNHAFGFEDSLPVGTFQYDGGIVEYNIGRRWIDAGPLFVDNGYTGVLELGGGNPLEGSDAFSGESNGYITSRMDLTSLAGENLQIRFRIGTDNSVDDYGWFIDDVNIYSCLEAAVPTVFYSYIPSVAN
jgi:Zn-dependent metalloprotease